jgi:hypothetical protein
MADEQDRAEALDEDKLDDAGDPAPEVQLVDNTADSDPGVGSDEADAGESGDWMEGRLAEEDDDPQPNFDGADVPAEEAAMHVIEP